MSNDILYHLIGSDGKVYMSKNKGKYGGHKRLKIYGRLDCLLALRYVASLTKLRLTFQWINQ